MVHHIDAARYSRVVPEDKARHQEWDHGDVAAYHHAREPYRVAAWSRGHTHARNLFRWDGTPDTKHKEHGIPFLNTDNTRHFGRLAQAFLPIEASMRLLRLPEFATKDGWQAATDILSLEFPARLLRSQAIRDSPDAIARGFDHKLLAAAASWIRR